MGANEKDRDTREELSSLLEQLKAQTGVTLSVDEGHPDGEAETIRQLRKLVAEAGFPDRAAFLKALLTGGIAERDLLDAAKSVRLSPGQMFRLWIVEAKADPETVSVLRSIYHRSATALIIKTDEGHLVLLDRLTGAAGGERSEAGETAGLISDTLSAETMQPVRTAYTVSPVSLESLRPAYTEGLTALRLAGIFYGGRRAVPIDRPGIARLIAEIPEPLCRSYLSEVFGDPDPAPPDEESINLVNAFLDSGLNLAETARRLYMHRNTLVYRLEKIGRETGLDLRRFEDAMTYRIASMIRDLLRSRSAK